MTYPTIPYTVDQAGWGSTLEYGDGTLSGDYDPRYVIIHWGGLTSERTTDELAFDTLRGWQRYHRSKGWQDIAYQWAVTEAGSICRLRGHNHGGHASGTDPATGKSWSTVGIGVVWVGGQADTDGPSPAALDAMQRLCDSAGLPVIGHQDTGKATACPGPDWLTWAHTYTPEEPMTDCPWTNTDEKGLPWYTTYPPCQDHFIGDIPLVWGVNTGVCNVAEAWEVATTRQAIADGKIITSDNYRDDFDAPMTLGRHLTIDYR